MSLQNILEELKKNGKPEKVAGMARFGIRTEHVLGTGIPLLRNLAKKYKKNHELALQLWQTGIHEARILAAFIDDPGKVTEKQMEEWVNDFTAWDICDQCCGNLFDKTVFAYDKASKWAVSDKEFVKRAGFSLMAQLAVHDKKAETEKFIPFLFFIETQAWDDRNFVKKAANWALREIGKRNMTLWERSVKTAEKLLNQPHTSSRWIARDALKELRSEKVIEKIKMKCP